jgi:hypothetical protein
MKKTFISFIMALTLVSGLYFGKTSGQTTGNLTFSVTTTEPSGGFTNKYVLAIWIRDNSGTFVKTKIKYAATRVQYLNVWISNSGQNVVDATTGSTQTVHKTHTITWNATNVSAALVPDADYQVWLQMADQNTNGATTSVTFTKGSSSVNLTPANVGNFTNMSLSWVPTNVGVSENKTSDNLFKITSNPVTSDSKILYDLTTLTDVTISVYDVTGKLVKVLADENQGAGSYSLPISSNNSLKPGVYFVKMYTGTASKTMKILVN